MTSARARLAALPLLVLLVVAVAVGAATRGTPGPKSTDRAASVDAASIVLTLLAIALAAGVALVIKGLLQAQGGSPGLAGKPDGLPWRSQALILAVAIGVMVGLFCLVYFNRSQFVGAHSAAPSAGRTKVLFTPEKPLPYSVSAGGLTAGAVAALGGGSLALAYLRRRRRRSRREPFLTVLDREPSAIFDARTQLRDPLTAIAVADPRQEPDPRKAVMAAWMTMSDVIGRTWRERDECETPFEYVREALTGAGVREGSAGRLTTLFEAARWGGRPVGEDMRSDAIAALDAVQADLQAAS